MKSYFEVDVKGLSSLLGEKSKTFLVNELVQNAWDEDITECIFYRVLLVLKTIGLVITMSKPLDGE